MSYIAKTLPELEAKMGAKWAEGENTVSTILTPSEESLIPLNAKGEPTDGWLSESRIKRGRTLPIPNINDMTDEELDYFVETFEWLWEKGASVKEIMENMEFQDKPYTPWQGELKKWHCYYFAKKLKLKKRHKFAKDE